MHNVFVYGTLKKGHGNHRLLDSSVFIGKGFLPSCTMYDLGGIPAVVKDGGPGVYGEVYEVTNSVLKDLDVLEGHPRFYTRVGKDIDLGNFTGRRKCWVYTMKSHDVQGLPQIPSGVYEKISAQRAFMK